MGFQENLRKFREAQGITAKDFAAKVGLKYGTYFSYETAGKEPKLETLCKIAAALHVTIDNLLGYSIPSVEIQANIARRAGIDVKEKGGFYSASLPQDVYNDDKKTSIMDRKLIDGLNLAPLPAADFDKAAKLARQHVIDEHESRYRLWLLTMIDHQHYLRSQEEKHIPLAELERAQKKQPPAK